MTISKLLLWMSFGCVAAVSAVLLAMLAGNEVAVWIGGHGLLYLGLPIAIFALTCGLAGLALRIKLRPVGTHDTSSRRGRGKVLGWIAFSLGLVLLIFLGFELVLFVILWNQGIDIASGFAPARQPPSFWMLFGFQMFDIKLPFALGALIFGLRTLGWRRHATG